MLTLIFKLRTYNRNPIPLEIYFQTIKQVELIEKTKFAITALDPEHKAFVVHVAALNVNSGDAIHSSRKAEIINNSSSNLVN